MRILRRAWNSIGKDLVEAAAQGETFESALARRKEYGPPEGGSEVVPLRVFIENVLDSPLIREETGTSIMEFAEEKFREAQHLLEHKEPEDVIEIIENRLGEAHAQLPYVLETKHALRSVQTRCGCMHFSWELPDGKVAVFEFVPEGCLQGVLLSYDSVEEYEKAIQDIEWIHGEVS